MAPSVFWAWSGKAPTSISAVTVSRGASNRWKFPLHTVATWRRASLFEKAEVMLVLAAATPAITRDGVWDISVKRLRR